jgi:hypothetical protein
VDKTQVETYGEPATFKYTVSVTHDGGTDSGWKVTGTITVSNPNNWEPVTLTGVTDAIDNGGNCSITSGNPTASIPEKSSVQLGYTCTYAMAPSPSSFTNTATASWDHQAASTPDGSSAGEAMGSFTTPTITDGSASVTDTLGGPLGTVSYTDPSPKKFEYTHTFSSDPAGTCTSHENTATFTTGTTGTKGSASQTVKVCVAGCTKAVGSGHYGPKSPLGDTLDNNLNTTLVGQQELQYYFENHTQHWGITKLTSASCVVTATERKFSGKALASLNGVKGYEVTFSITVKGGKIYFVAVLEKNHVVVREWHDEPLISGKETIS